MNLILFSKYAESPLAWECCDSNRRARTNIEYSVHFNPKYILKKRFEDVFYFRCSAGNISCASNDPFSCIWKTLEHESIGMAKYDCLKSATRSKGMWRNL